MATETVEIGLIDNLGGDYDLAQRLENRLYRVPYTMEQAKFEVASGAHEIVPAVAGHQIQVLAVGFASDKAGIKFYSGVGQSVLVHKGSTWNVPAVRPYNPIFATNVGEALGIDVGTDGTFAFVHIYYKYWKV